MTFLLFQSTSYSTAELKNEATLSAVSEEHALIAVQYGEGRLFSIINNMENAIRISSNGAINFIANDSFYIEPGSYREFTIEGHPEDLNCGSIQINAVWDEGSADIQSIIPQTTSNQILLELIDEEVVEEKVEVEVEVVPVVDEETSKVLEETVITEEASEALEETVISEEQQENLEIVKEPDNLEVNDVEIGTEKDKEKTGVMEVARSCN